MQAPQSGKGFACLGRAGEGRNLWKGSNQATPLLPYTLLIYPRSILIVCQYALSKPAYFVLRLCARMGDPPFHQQKTLRR
jgi:hypothetical protein